MKKQTNKSSVASELPLGLGMAFAQNPAAMARFTAMSETERQAVIDAAHGVQSKKEMNALVQKLTSGGTMG